jgi:salicylate hydroxylase
MATTNGTNGTHPHHHHHEPLQILIIGAGLGGLACAIACRHAGHDVLILEKAAELSEIGAGIQLPPNATRVMHHFNLIPQLLAGGAIPKEENYILRWQDGTILGCRPEGTWASSKFGYRWHVMHRADYQNVLADEARRLGVEMRLGQDVISVDCKDARPVVHLADGEKVEGDVVVGADGLRSSVRTSLLGYVKEPEESGDLAYRVTIPVEELKDETDEFIRGIVDKKTNAIWWGQNMHVVLYSVRFEKVLNLVLMYVFLSFPSLCLGNDPFLAD